MKVVFAESPARKDRDYSIEKAMCPPGTQFQFAIFDPKAQDNSQFYRDIADADVVIDVYTYFGRKEIDAMDHCKCISFQSSGYSLADLDYAAQKGIAVASVVDYCKEEVSTHAIALMLTLQRGIWIHNRTIQEKKIWSTQTFRDVTRLETQTLGAIGLGRIGQLTAKKAMGLGMKVIAYDPYLPPEVASGIGVELVDFDTLLNQADVITIHMNLTAENTALLGRKEFEKMAKRPYIINVARGLMIDEEALVWALDQGLIRGAGLDVLKDEYPELENHPLLGRDNVILTPHVGFYSKTSLDKLTEYAMENALLCYNGQYEKARAVRNGVGLSKG